MIAKNLMRHQDINILQFEITSYCNSLCPHCPRFDENGDLHPDLSLEHWNMDRIITALDFDKMTNLRDVTIEGDKGDPLMHPKINVLLDKILSHPSRPRIALVTNGCIRDIKWWRELGARRAQRLEVTFSIDGLEDTYHLYRRGLDYHKVIENARAFIDAGGHAIWKFLTFEHNQHQIDDAMRLSKELGFTSFNWAPSHMSRFHGRPAWEIKDQQGNYEIRPATVISTGDTRTTGKGRAIDPVPQRLCPNLSRGHIYVNYQGMVIPCCMMHFDTKLNYFGTDHLSQLTGGVEKQNLNLHSLQQVLENEFFSNNLIHSLKSGNWHFNCIRSCETGIKQNLEISNDISH